MNASNTSHPKVHSTYRIWYLEFPTYIFFMMPFTGHFYPKMYCNQLKWLPYSSRVISSMMKLYFMQYYLYFTYQKYKALFRYIIFLLNLSISSLKTGNMVLDIGVCVCVFSREIDNKHMLDICMIYLSILII